MIRLALVDDHSLFRGGLRGLLSTRFEVVVEAASGEEFLAALSEAKVDVAVMDFAMGAGLDGAQTTERALRQQPDLKVITLSMFGDAPYYTRMVEAGARGFLMKDAPLSEVVQAIEAVQAGGDYFSEAVRRQLAGVGADEDALSAREREILQCVCRGLSTAQIADELFISPRTVEKHRAALLEKTGAQNTASLIVHALRRGMVNFF